MVMMLLRLGRRGTEAFEPVDTDLIDMVITVVLLVELWWAISAVVTPQMVADPVGKFGDRSADCVFAGEGGLPRSLRTYWPAQYPDGYAAPSDSSRRMGRDKASRLSVRLP
jgi:hypothetical protein